MCFNKVRNVIAKLLDRLGADELADSIRGEDEKKLEKKLKGLEAQSKAAKARIQKALNDFQSPANVETDGTGAFTEIIEKIKAKFQSLTEGGESEGGMFGGMVEGFSAGVDGILNKIMESNPVLAKFWATLKGQNDPDVAAAEGGGQTAMADMSWSEKWIAAIGKIKEAFASMGASSKQTVKGMIERYDTFEEVLNKGIKNLKKNSHIRKGILMKESIIEGKAAILKAWNSAPFPANLPGVAITTAATAMAIRDIMKGQAHDGMDSLPSTGTYMLEKGERVVSSRTNRDLTDFLASSSGGQSNMNAQPVTIQVNGISDPDMVVDALASRRGELEAMMRSIASENTRLSPF